MMENSKIDSFNQLESTHFYSSQHDNENQEYMELLFSLEEERESIYRERAEKLLVVNSLLQNFDNLVCGYFIKEEMISFEVSYDGGIKFKPRISRTIVGTLDQKISTLIFNFADCETLLIRDYKIKRDQLLD